MDKILTKLILSVTSNCNLRCRYCYVFNAGIGYLVPQTMSHDICRQSISHVFDSYDSVYFIQFFGGEPNLAIKTMQVAVSEVRRICELRNIDLPRFGIITNLTHLDESIISFYKNNHVNVTVSIDGPKAIHDLLRRNLSGHHTYDEIKHNLNLLKNADIDFGIECTFTRLHIENHVSIIDLLKCFHTLGAEQVSIVPVMTSQGSDLDVYGEYVPHISQLFLEAIDYWFDYWEQGGRMKFGVVGEVVSSLKGTSNDGVYCPAGTAYLGIAPDGSIYPCQLFFGNGKYLMGTVGSPHNYPGGNIPLPYSDQCNKCFIKQICVPCLGRNEYYNGSWELPFADECDLQRAIVSKVIQHLSSIVGNASL